MNLTGIKLSYLFSCLVLLSFGTSAYAADDNVIVISTEMVSSIEACPIPKKDIKELDCKTYHQTTDYTCGPSAVMTMMNYYGMLSSNQMNHATEIRIAKEMGATADGTTPDQVGSWLSDHGFHVDSGQRVDADTLIDNIKKGIPVLIAFNHHWLLAKGYSKGETASEDKILFSDSCCNMAIMSRETIDSMWLEAQMPANHCTENQGDYIIAVPKG